MGKDASARLRPAASSMVKWACTALSLFLTACGTTVISKYDDGLVLKGPRLETRDPDPKHGKRLVVIIDGTSNDARDRTNASRLHEVIANQAKPDIDLFYTEGVGSDARGIGLITGWGMAKDVKDAYRFLAETRRPEDQIYLIGFSRGAFATRILNDLILTAGIPDLRAEGGHVLKHAQRVALVDHLYDAYKNAGRGLEPAESLAQRRDRVGRILDSAHLLPRDNVKIAAMLLWDTVASLGKPDFNDNPLDEDKAPYLDQLCNVAHVVHALSLDDDRPVDFTPILADDIRTRSTCGPDKTSSPVIDEVWFSGAHADVGGTYSRDLALHGNLPGVSLNWMMSRLREIDCTLLPADAQQYANEYDPVHNAREALHGVWKIRKRDFRRPLKWTHDDRYSSRTLRLHYTVEQRFAVLHEIDRLAHKRAEHMQRYAQEPEPKLLSAKYLENYGVLRELRDPKCVDEILDEAGNVLGYKFSGKRLDIAGKAAVSIKCGDYDLEIVYDTIPQKMAIEKQISDSASR